MRKSLKHVASLAIVSFLTALTFGHARCAVAQGSGAQEMKNLAVVAISPYDEVIRDVDYVGQLSGMPGIAQLIEVRLNLLTQGQGLAGLDKTKPWGAVLRTDGIRFEPLIFLPVTDLNQLFEILAGLNIEAEEGDGGVYQVQIISPGGPQAIFVKEQAGWAFISQTEEGLNNLPADPEKILEVLNRDYDLSIRLHVQNIPQVYRSMAIDQLKATIIGNQERLPDEDNEEFELRKQLLQTQVKSLVALVEGIDDLTVGWSLDAKQQKSFLDLVVTAVPNSELANQVAVFHDLKTEFGGFSLPDAALEVKLVSKYPPDKAEEQLAMLKVFGRRAEQEIDNDETLPNDQVRTISKLLLKDFLHALEATIKSGTIDGGAALQFNTESLTFIAGSQLVDANRLEAGLKKLFKMVENKPGISRVQWDTGSHGDIHFHSLTVLIPERQEEARKILGAKVDAILGLGPNRLYVAVGDAGLTSLKTAIDRSKAKAGTPAKPLVLSLDLGRLMSFVASQSGNSQAAEFAELLRSDGVEDRLDVTVGVVTNGLKYRIEVEGGVLEALGKVAPAGGALAPVGL